MRARAVILATLLAATSAGATEPLRRPLYAEPESLDPQHVESDVAITVVRDLFAGLLVLDNQRRPQPGIADRWEISADAKTWTFHFRPEARWSNGDPVTAADFVWAYRRFVDPKTAPGDTTDMESVENAREITAGRVPPESLGVEAVDPVTFRIHLREPRADLPYILTEPDMGPLPRAAIEAWGKDWTRPEHMIGDGPFRMTAWIPQAEIVLARNPAFYDAVSVRLDEVHWILSQDPETGLRRYRGGELDFVEVPDGSLAKIRSEAPKDLHSALSAQIWSLDINMRKGPLAADIRLREALNLAIDRETLTTRVSPRGEAPAYSYVPSLTTGWTTPSMPLARLTQAERGARARALLAAAGFGPDHPLALTVAYAASARSRQVLLGIAAMLRPFGLDLKLEDVEYQVFMARLDQRDFELGFSRNVASYDDFGLTLLNFYSPAGIDDDTGYSNPDFDRLFHDSMTEMDPAKRLVLGETAERLMLTDFPIVPLYFEALNRLVNPRLEGFPDGIVTPQSRYLGWAK